MTTIREAFPLDGPPLPVDPEVKLFDPVGAVTGIPEQKVKREHDWGDWQICTRCGAEMMNPVDFVSPCEGDDGPVAQNEEDDPECE